MQALDGKVQRQLVKKLKELEQHVGPISLAKPLKNFNFGQYRWRIDPYRITFDLDGRTIYLLTVRHRSEVYKRSR